MTALRPDSLLMVRPYRFEYNTETAVDNAFQQACDDPTAPMAALAEFDAMVDALSDHAINTLIAQDTPYPATPDSIFPNNWASYHPDGTLVLYPMHAASRRPEADKRVLPAVHRHYTVHDTIDLRQNAAHGQFLEGTGSIIFDHEHQIAYANYSNRTDPQLFHLACKLLRYEAIGFRAVDEQSRDIYHTNVMMSIADSYAVVCLDAIRSRYDRSMVTSTLASTGKEVIPISYDQLHHFAGNTLQVFGRDGSPYQLFSQQAYDSLTPYQLDKISEHATLLPVPVPTVERCGGGSVRCMVAEVFLPLKPS